MPRLTTRVTKVKKVVWQAQTKRHGKYYLIGCFDTREEAQQAEVDFRRVRGWPVGRSEAGYEAAANARAVGFAPGGRRLRNG